jgi:hypothetical protein
MGWGRPLLTRGRCRACRCIDSQFASRVVSILAVRRRKDTVGPAVVQVYEIARSTPLHWRAFVLIYRYNPRDASANLSGRISAFSHQSRNHLRVAEQERIDITTRESKGKAPRVVSRRVNGKRKAGEETGGINKLVKLLIVTENYDGDIAFAEDPEFIGLFEQAVLPLLKCDGPVAVIIDWRNLNLSATHGSKTTENSPGLGESRREAIRGSGGTPGRTAKAA